MTKTQNDRLGDRLRKGQISDDDLRLLDQYRRSFTEAYEIVVGTIREELSQEPTGRPAKSTTSIAEKLQREHFRLTQIQDIAGCRVIVPDIAAQDFVVQSLQGFFEHTTVMDRRENPSHGYRAVHVITRCRDKLIEIQVRTLLQHSWAELSEKLSDVIDPAIKYGGGGEAIRSLLTRTSDVVAHVESVEIRLVRMKAQSSSITNFPDSVTQQIAGEYEEVSSTKQTLFALLQDMINDTLNIEG